MNKISQFQGTLIPLDRSNIDTDAILPKQYLKMLDKTGYGDFLFDDERYLDPGDSETPLQTRRKNQNFILNIPPYNRGTILVSKKNFGCGSSREHAVWAIRDFGIRVIIAESFGEIFFNNCIKNGVAPIILGKEQVASLINFANKKPDAQVSINLTEGILSFDGTHITFSLHPSHRKSLSEGLDEIEETLAIGDKIRAYECSRLQSEPWVFVDF
ncbi:3-isopropylmalate dehydratase small subunit [Marinobacter pelagius]|uniref:3-isopropylmalate dehydratase small subunit n=1 Tax=Marinobacter sp. C7 TaxID=2951363 RepID=UPI001EF14066|nr:3-isopropylmalate dehydratase small subunit [Marinobacter sp. C7]MCG7198705.1 3-isopropylmalate dehydratase small subunit [Marinobacter sp. C7]